MIEAVVQTEYQEQEARTPHSLARQMVALLIRRERSTYRQMRAVKAKGGDEDALNDARATWIEARRASEVVMRILFGWGTMR